MPKLLLLLFTFVIGAGLIASDSTAQTSPPAGTRLITLGTQGGPTPRPHRSSNLLIVNGALYVVDAGDGVARRLAKAGINVRDIGTVFITHHHDDHTAGLGTLMSAALGAKSHTADQCLWPAQDRRLGESRHSIFRHQC